jgi:prepilin-type N-terminal cleavage/methylation domain-containing protein
MIKRNNKKGFTIVELVIVIAVIAILAAVLIPTFSGIIRKANISADTQLAKNLNEILAADEAVDGKPANFSEVLNIFRENGYLVANLNPTAADCYFVWESETNQIILVDAKNEFEVIYNSKELTNTTPNNTWHFAVSNKADAAELKAKDDTINVVMTIAAGSDLNSALGAITGTDTIYIDESLVIDKNNVIVLDNANANVTIDLGTSAVSGNNGGTPSYNNIPFSVKAGELTLTGGVISSTGDAYDADGEIMNNVILVDGATLNVKDSKIDASGSSIPLAFSEAKATLTNVEIVANDNVVQPSNGSEVLLKNCKIECAWLGVFSSSSGGTASAVTIEGGTYHATTSNLLGVHGGSIVVKDGTFNCDNAEKTLKFYNVTGGKIVIEGGTFNGVAFANLNEATLRGMCNLSECAKGITVTQENGAWVLTVK